ncbi:MAG: type II toxin-antitoxin system prevent-host-death family antitoxin [Terrimicrobiaceae bacterium]|nr:type II toxin-antitoxin system prevent-host-death family antitoxin [Terrimicrobiaceae bacterium]
MKKSSSSKSAGRRSSVVRETSATEPFGDSVSVRTAKAHLSALLEMVSAGREITITSDGVPKARIVPTGAKPRKLFTGTREHLASMPPWSGGPTAEEIIREERDSRP